MIEYINVLDAVNIVNRWRKLEDETSAVTRQLAKSLQIYTDRGEFDGTMNSAYECLKQAGFFEDGVTL